MNKTSIEWTHRPETGGAAGGFTWNPIRARRTVGASNSGAPPRVTNGTFCTRISPGCKNCYASVINQRFGTGAEYTVPNLAEHEFYIDERILEQSLKRKKPATIFVGDMFDLFHEAIPDELISAVWTVMANSRQHTFQVLTKRVERMRFTLTKWQRLGLTLRSGYGSILPNVWLGVSIEDQQRADERIPLLLQTPASVRFLSVEPMLEAVDLDGEGIGTAHALGCGDPSHRDRNDGDCRGVDWVICGGESGHGARPFNLAWAESLLGQCKNAGVPFFMKQIGGVPMWTEDFWRSQPIRLLCCNNRDRVPPGHVPLKMVDRKGGDPAEWPEHLRVREFPR
jgi:protein gp37